MWLKSASVRRRFASVVCGFCRSILYGPEPGPKLIALQKKTKKNYWQLTNLNRFLLLEVTKIQWSSKFSHVVLLTTQSLCHSSCNQQFWLQWALYNTLSKCTSPCQVKIRSSHKANSSSIKIRQWICQISNFRKERWNPLDSNSVTGLEVTVSYNSTCAWLLI